MKRFILSLFILLFAGNVFAAVTLYKEADYELITAGGTNGVAITSSSPLDVGLFDTEADTEGDVFKCAARTSSGTETNVVIAPTGATSTRYALSSNGTTWGDWGASLNIGTVGTTNVVFYAKARGLTTDDLGAGADPLITEPFDSLSAWSTNIGRSDPLPSITSGRADFNNATLAEGAEQSFTETGSLTIQWQMQFSENTGDGRIWLMAPGATSITDDAYLFIIGQTSANARILRYVNGAATTLADQSLSANTDNHTYQAVVNRTSGDITFTRDGVIIAFANDNTHATFDKISIFASQVGTPHCYMDNLTVSVGLPTAISVDSDSSGINYFNVKRRVVPYLSDLGTAGNHYMGFTVGANTWEHDTTNHGDMDVSVYASGSTAYNDIKYTAKDISGQATTLTKTLTSGLDMEVKYTKKKAGVYLVEMTFTSDILRYLKLTKNITGAGTANTSTVTLYKDNTTRDISTNPYLETFQAIALHHTSGVAVGIVAGDGYANEWTINTVSHTTDTSWWNNKLLEKTSSRVSLSYGILANASTTDYSVHLEAGVPKTLHYVITLDAPQSQRDVGRMFYDSYTDALHVNSSGLTSSDKLFWATAHQLQRIKRHYHGEQKWHWFVPSAHYSPDFYPQDPIWMVFGLNDAAIAQNVLDTFHALSRNATDTDGLSGASDSMAGAAPYYDPVFELYTRNFLGVTVPAAVVTALTTSADNYAAGIGQMVPLSWGGIEDTLTYAGNGGQTVTRWTAQTAGAGSSATRVGVDGGVTPYAGSYQAKLTADTAAGNYARFKLMKIAVPQSTALTITARVNIPTGFSANGFKITVLEHGSTDSLITSHSSSYTATTTGWEQKTYGFTTGASTYYIYIIAEATGDETAQRTAYVDDVHCTMDTPPYPGMRWTNSTMPDGKLDNYIGFKAISHSNGILYMLCIKELIGANWTATHQTTLENIQNTFPSAFWYDGSNNKIREDKYHPIRREWLSLNDVAQPQFHWYVLSGGGKILTDAQFTAIYNAFPKTSVGHGYGDVAFFENIKADGSYTQTSEWVYAFAGGDYQNGGTWLVVDAMMYLCAKWAGVSDAAQKLQARLAIETAVNYTSHEYIVTSAAVSDYQTCPVGQRGYGWNVLLLSEAVPFALDVSNVDALGCDLTWAQYDNPGSDFANYKLYRHTSPHFDVADATLLTTATAVDTLTFHDETADPNTFYYYRVVMTKTGGATLSSEEVGVLTAGNLNPGAFFMVW